MEALEGKMKRAQQAFLRAFMEAVFTATGIVSMRALAREAGLSNVHMNEVVHCRRPLSRATAEAVATALERWGAVFTGEAKRIRAGLTPYVAQLDAAKKEASK